VPLRAVLRTADDFHPLDVGLRRLRRALRGRRPPCPRGPSEPGTGPGGTPGRGRSFSPAPRAVDPASGLRLLDAARLNEPDVRRRDRDAVLLGPAPGRLPAVLHP